MKKLLKIFGLATICVAFFSLVSCSDKDNDEPVNQGQLPQTAMNFLQKYFPSEDIMKVLYDKDKNDQSYEVYLVNGFEITFTKSGEWTDVDAPNGMTIPDGIAPEPIATYVATNYVGNGINEIEKTSYGYDVELVNGVDLKFDKAGELLM